MNLILDTSILGQLCHPAKETNKPAVDWITQILESGSEDRLFVPEICDYELRRKLIHLIRKGQAHPFSQSSQRFSNFTPDSFRRGKFGSTRLRHNWEPE